MRKVCVPRLRACAKTLGCVALLFALNAYITLRLFRTGYTRQMGSIEAAFVSLARYASQHWNDMGWFPLWYGGIPYPDTYPPLLHWTCGLLISLIGLSPGLAYHFVTALLYSLGPVALFWMAWRLCGNRACAFATAAGYSLVSPSCLLVKEIRLDAGGWLAARRLQDLVVYGEGPHIASLCLLALAVGMLHVALDKRKPGYWVAAALAIASVPMSNWLGGMALAMGIGAYLFAGLPSGQQPIPTCLRVAAVGVYAYALVVPWLSPATIAVIRANAPRVANNYQFNARQRLFASGVALVFLLAAWAMSRWKLPRHARFALLFLLVTASTTLSRFWFRLSLVPQPDRYPVGDGHDVLVGGGVCILASSPAVESPRSNGDSRGRRGSPHAHRHSAAARGPRDGSADRHPPRHRVQERAMAEPEPARRARLRARHDRFLAQRLQRFATNRGRLRQWHPEPQVARRDFPDPRRGPATAHHRLDARLRRRRRHRRR